MTSSQSGRRDRVDGGERLGPPLFLKGLEHGRRLALEDGVDGRDLLLEDARKLLAGLLGRGGRLAASCGALRPDGVAAALEELLEALVAVLLGF